MHTNIMQRFKKYIEEDVKNTGCDSDGMIQVNDFDFDSIKDVVYLSIVECAPQDPIKYRFITRSGSDYKTMAIDNNENNICMEFVRKIIESDNYIECLVMTSLTISSFVILDVSNIGSIIVYRTICSMYVNKNILDKLYIYTPSYLLKLKGRFKSKTMTYNQQYLLFDMISDIEVVQIKFDNYDKIINEYDNNIDGTKLLLLPDDIKYAIIDYF